MYLDRLFQFVLAYPDLLLLFSDALIRNSYLRLKHAQSHYLLFQLFDDLQKYLDGG